MNKKWLNFGIILIFLMFLVGCRTSKGQDGTEMKAEVKTVLTENVEMDYVKFGTGKKTFVILPGLSIHSVMGLADAIATSYQSFAGQYTVYLFDRAKNLQEGYSVRDMARDTASAMRALGLSNADIFGASQGGMIAQYLAIDYPELVHSMVLGSTLSKGNETFSSVARLWLEKAENRDEQGLLEAFVDVVYSEATLKEYRDVLISANKGISEAEYERFLILARACQDFDCYQELTKVQCPVLVLGSEGDCVVTAEGSRELAQKLGCAIYLYDSSYGHAVYDEAPDYKERCLAFFESLN